MIKVIDSGISKTMLDYTPVPANNDQDIFPEQWKPDVSNNYESNSDSDEDTYLNTFF